MIDYSQKNKTIAESLGWYCVPPSESIIKPNRLDNIKHYTLFRPTYSIFDLHFHSSYEWLMYAVEYLELYEGLTIKIQDQRIDVRTVTTSEYLDYVEKADGFITKFDIIYEGLYRYSRWFSNNKAKKAGDRLPYNRNKLGYNNIEKSSEEYRQFILEQNSELIKFETTTQFVTLDLKSPYLGLGEYTKSKNNIANLKIEQGQWLVEFKLHHEKLKLIGNIEKDISYVNKLTMVNSKYSSENLTLTYTQNITIENILIMCAWSNFGSNYMFTGQTLVDEDNLIWMESIKSELGDDPFKLIKDSMIAVKHIWGESSFPIHTAVEPRSGNVAKIIINFDK